jgi:hypothetical protein
VALGLSVVIAGAVYLAISLFGDEEEHDAGSGVTVSEIAHQRGKFIDRTVTIESEIQELYSPTLFLVGPDDDKSERIVVETKEPLVARSSAALPREGQRVRVTGRVDAVDLKELNRGGDPVGESVERDLADRALIHAERVKLGPSTAAKSDRALVKPREVLAHPERYLGDLTTVPGKVDRVLSANAFLVGGLPVVTRLNAAEQVFDGDFLEVTGPTRRLDVRELERKLGIDLPEEIGRYEGRPVIVARAIDRAGRPPHPDAGVDPRSIE